MDEDVKSDEIYLFDKHRRNVREILFIVLKMKLNYLNFNKIL